MLATPIWIDGAVERNIRRIIVIDQRLAAVDDHLGLQRRQFRVQTAPAVILGLPALLFEAAGDIADAGAAFVDQGFGHNMVEQYEY